MNVLQNYFVHYQQTEHLYGKKQALKHIKLFLSFIDLFCIALWRHKTLGIDKLLEYRLLNQFHLFTNNFISQSKLTLVGFNLAYDLFSLRLAFASVLIWK
ncbi:hypothetical protein SAMN05421882_103625 [Nitrosomonas communis]|uniref:Uncharacterized protein n=1 Tax=Nitrosomonas communis TaxID=44574 RepID=A0A1H2XA92_9PROT|nr:hypothetical protein SAMN05421882_103625 [Nitrosomonas communis]